MDVYERTTLKWIKGLYRQVSEIDAPYQFPCTFHSLNCWRASQWEFAELLSVWWRSCTKVCLPVHRWWNLSVSIVILKGMRGVSVILPVSKWWKLTVYCTRLVVRRVWCGVWQTVCIGLVMTCRHGVQLLLGWMELFILLFADDVILLATTPNGLQNQLDCLKLCCKKLKMEVAKVKTKIMVFWMGGYLSKFEKWHCDDCNLEVVNEYCYLGFKFTTVLSLKQGANYI